MKNEQSILKRQRKARLSLARNKAKDPDMKRIWGNKIKEIDNKPIHYGDDPNWRLRWSKFFRRMP
jgi:hypothetical protein|tara:strand:- start:2080 stop:2274 length:195 start_codon:yes stop_codon:yes gene_type:complete